LANNPSSREWGLEFSRKENVKKKVKGKKLLKTLIFFFKMKTFRDIPFEKSSNTCYWTSVSANKFCISNAFLQK
jgi:hypothetical protein